MTVDQIINVVDTAEELVETLDDEEIGLLIAYLQQLSIAKMS